MRYGVKAENIKSGRTFRATGNVFEKNFFGISTRAVDNFEVRNNEFVIGEFDGPTSDFTFPNRQTGMLVDQCSGFSVEDNDFSAAASLPSGAEPVGLAVNNTNVGSAGDLNSETNQAFRNTFTSLYRANVANGENGGSEGFGGFRYFCNLNITNLCTDFTVFDGNIAAVQRAVSGNAAGNTFTQNNNCNPFGDFDNSSASPITYHYYNGSSGNIEEPLFVPILDFEKIVQTENLCTDEGGSPGPFPPGGEGGTIAEFPTARQNYLNLRQQYTSQLDGGNTNYVLNAIASMNNANSAIFQQLQQMSPWLSTEALLAFTEHSVPSASQKETLLVANPDGIKGIALNNSIKNGGWFTSQQIANINTAAQGTTSRTQVEDNLRAAQSELQGITQALESYYQIDEADNGLDYANQATWAANGESLDGYLRSIDNRLWAGDVTTAQNEIAAVQAMDMSTTQAQEIGYFVQLKNLEIDLLNSSRSYDEVTNTEIGDLQTIAVQSSGRASIQAQNWLHLLGISEAQSEAYWGGSNAALMNGGNVPVPEEATSPMREYIQVHPNPSTGVFRFHLQSQDDLEEGTLVIYNMSGQEVYQDVVTSGSHIKWQPAQQEAGFYFFALKGQKGAVFQQGKLVYMPE